MEQNRGALAIRTKQFALRACRLVEKLPNGRTADVVARQLVKSATSVAANYRSACRGRSTAEFCAKLGIVEEESDESAYWLEFISDFGLMRKELVDKLLTKANEIVAMTVASIKTARRR